MTLELRHPARVDVVVVSGIPGTLSLIEDALAGEDAQIGERLWDAQGRAAVAWERPDLVVLDAGTPGDVAERTRYLRRRWPTLQVVVVNAPNIAAVLELMEAGADDATVQCTPAFRARLRSSVRHASALNAASRIAVGDIVFEREAHRVWCDGREIDMSPREFAVLDCLFWKAPSIVSADSLADFVWGDASLKARRGVVEVYISYLRRKLASSKQVVIGTVRGAGYRFESRAEPPEQRRTATSTP
ncbi:MAG: phosphate regulatory protein [Gemmatimonadetes bacterium]|nr:phosphate regulatory protein [Gemmatimonadota bacterium]